MDKGSGHNLRSNHGNHGLISLMRRLCMTPLSKTPWTALAEYEANREWEIEEEMRSTICNLRRATAVRAVIHPPYFPLVCFHRKGETSPKEGEFTLRSKLILLAQRVDCSGCHGVLTRSLLRMEALICPTTKSTDSWWLTDVLLGKQYPHPEETADKSYALLPGLVYI